MAFYGGLTVEALDALHVDKLFLGVDGFDLERGITTHYEPEAMLNRKMVEAARRGHRIADSSKFGKICLHRIIPVTRAGHADHRHRRTGGDRPGQPAARLRVAAGVVVQRVGAGGDTVNTRLALA